MKSINESQNKSDIVLMSRSLKLFLNEKLIIKQDIEEDIFEWEIDELLDWFEEINQTRKNEITIPGEIAFEFIEIFKDKVKQRSLNLGVLKIEIGGLDFSVKEFLEYTDDIAYSLILKIHSIEDLKEKEIKFLKKNDNISYEYAGTIYKLDNLIEVVKKMKKLVKNNEKLIKSTKKDLRRAEGIAKTVFENIQLYVPNEYRPELNEVTLENGEKMEMPKILIRENTTKFTNLEYVFAKKTADYVGMKKLCKECLRNDGYQVIETVESINNYLQEEVIIGEKTYGIMVTIWGIDIVRMDN